MWAALVKSGMITTEQNYATAMVTPLVAYPWVEQGDRVQQDQLDHQDPQGQLAQVEVGQAQQEPAATVELVASLAFLVLVVGVANLAHQV